MIAEAAAATDRSNFIARGVTAYYAGRPACENVSISFAPRAVTALIGPSGCGKSTFLRCLNRLHEEIPDATVEGAVVLNGANIYADGFQSVLVRRSVGMVLQKPCPFPTMSIWENAIAGLRYSGRTTDRHKLREIAERVLVEANLWDEVKDVLDRPGVSLSGGQQQRLCVARAIAVRPQVLLLDEPASALDPLSTVKLEELIVKLAKEMTIVIVTHNLQQAVRISQFAAFMLSGEDRVGRMIEFGPAGQLFTHPRRQETADYVSGRFG
jgi:phosphate transport system ATP-binding protein